MSLKSPLTVILGPTAAGKTKVATHLAARVGGEIIRADSRQVYHQLDIGTGKDLSDYCVNNKPIIGLKVPRELRRQWTTDHLESRLDNGLIEEVEGLVKSGVNKDRLRYFGLEYKFVTDYLGELFDRNTLFDKLNITIHPVARRQMTWFRKMEKQGHEINWIDVQLPLDEKVQEIVDKYWITRSEI